MLQSLVNYVFEVVLDVQFILIVLAGIGVYALTLWIIDNFKSVVQIVAAVLAPYFQPQESLTLAERYGNWAGKHYVPFTFIFRFFDTFYTNRFYYLILYIDKIQQLLGN